MSSPSIVSTWDIKALWPLGDEAAIALIKMYPEAFLLQPRNLNTALLIVSAAFEQPSMIASPDDREPRVALFLLKVLQRDVGDEKYKEKIAEVIKRLDAPRPDPSPSVCDDPLGTVSSLITPANLRNEAPDLTLHGAHGAIARLSDRKGRVVLLNFWAPRQAYSKMEVPWFIELQARYGGRGFEVIGVLVDPDGLREFNTYLAQKGLALNYAAPLGDRDAVGRFGVTSPPTTVLVDRDGRVEVSHYLGASGVGPFKCTYEEEIQVLLAEAASKTAR
jgi:thiol-disulfide isomerase/thioredoxin